MFATLDGLEGSVELLVFGRALAAHEERARARLGRARARQGRPQGRHDDVRDPAGASRFEPSEAEIERARGAGARDPGRAAAGAAAARRDRAAGEHRRGPQAADRAAPRRVRRRARPADAPRPAQAQARPRVPRRRDERRACAPSSTTCSAARCSTPSQPDRRGAARTAGIQVAPREAPRGERAPREARTRRPTRRATDRRRARSRTARAGSARR